MTRLFELSRETFLTVFATQRVLSGLAISASADDRQAGNSGNNRPWHFLWISHHTHPDQWSVNAIEISFITTFSILLNQNPASVTGSDVVFLPSNFFNDI